MSALSNIMPVRYLLLSHDNIIRGPGTADWDAIRLLHPWKGNNNELVNLNCLVVERYRGWSGYLECLSRSAICTAINSLTIINQTGRMAQWQGV
jgi:hypothetical protein